jgi:adenosine deaminase
MKSLLIRFVLAVAVLLGTVAHADERAAARRFELARRDEPSLIAFLKAMPKGGDLHNHLSGALYVEDGLRHAISQGLFFNPTTNRFEAEKSEANVPAARLLEDDDLRHGFFDAASMRGAYRGAAGGHDHFFRTFGIFGTAFGSTPVEDVLGPIVHRARLQNLQYLELMHNPGDSTLARVRAAAGPTDTPERMLARVRPLLGDYVRAARAELDTWDRVVSRQLGLPLPLSAADQPITVRYQVAASRLAPDENILATWAAGFALMRADPRVVGVNLLAPEDHPIARERFGGQMRILNYLWQTFDRPNVSLHAGELNLFLSPLEDLTHHIRDSIEIGRARRIGHGTAVAWENDLPGLLRKMRDERIAVEVCPTSAAVILGKDGDRYPFHLYRRAGVPLTINTDDEGVSRSNLTMEYLRAVNAWNLGYRDLKELARNSIEYSFLPGESLFEDGNYRRVRGAYRALHRRGWTPATERERSALKASDKATVQARLERALAEFEQAAR